MKLELGSGGRPTPGYCHQDVYEQPGTDLDHVGPASSIALPDNTVTEVLALGVVEHFTRSEAKATFANVYRMLAPGGVFLFDVPDLKVWCQYLVDYENGALCPFSRDHILATLYGWQRWDGDEHKSGWTRDLIELELRAAGFRRIDYGLAPFKARGLDRRRFSRPHDAHLYVEAR